MVKIEDHVCNWYIHLGRFELFAWKPMANETWLDILRWISDWSDYKIGDLDGEGSFGISTPWFMLFL